MNQPEALRLADELDAVITPYCLESKAAAELRRLSAVEAQRDALLGEISALREVLLYSLDNQGRYRKKHRKIIDAIIKAVEGEKT